MKKIKKILLALIGILYISCSFSQNAGVSSFGSITTCPNTIVTISLNIVNSPSISAISLKIVYDANVLSFVQNANVGYGLINPNASLSGITANQTNDVAGFKQLRISWYSGTGVVVNSNGTGKIADFQFSYNGGTTSLLFDNSSNLGSSCEYADSLGNPLNDNPTSIYYVNGSVTQGNVPSITGSISGNINVNPGSYQTYSVPFSPGITYLWNVPSTWTGTSISNSITYYVGSSCNAIISVTPSNTCGTGNVLSSTVFCSTGILSNSNDIVSNLINYPNPFKKETTIEFNLLQSGFVTVSIFNFLGEELTTIKSNYYSQGKHKITLNCSNLPVGVYYYGIKYESNRKIYVKNNLMSIIR